MGWRGLGRLPTRVAARVTTTNRTTTVGTGIKVRRVPRARMLTQRDNTAARVAAAVAGRRARAAAGAVVVTATDRGAARVGLTALRDSG